MIDPMEQLALNTALIVIDVQDGFDHPSWGSRNNPHAEENIARLLSAWRRAGEPVFYVRHLSLEPGSVLGKENPGSAIKAIVAPLACEPIILKHVNSAFIGTTLEQELRDRNIACLVITGLTTDHCVSTTTRMAANLGFHVYCVSDATATFDRLGPRGRRYTADEVHDVSLASLSGEFATVASTEEVLGAIPESVTV